MSGRGHTDRTIHGFAPKHLESASVAILSYSFAMLAGALVGPGREKGAFMSSLTAGESFDIVVVCLFLVYVRKGRWRGNHELLSIVAREAEAVFAFCNDRRGNKCKDQGMSRRLAHASCVPPTMQKPRCRKG